MSFRRGRTFYCQSIQSPAPQTCCGCSSQLGQHNYRLPDVLETCWGCSSGASELLSGFTGNHFLISLKLLIPKLRMLKSSFLRYTSTTFSTVVNPSPRRRRNVLGVSLTNGSMLSCIRFILSLTLSPDIRNARPMAA